MAKFVEHKEGDQSRPASVGGVGSVTAVAAAVSVSLLGDASLYAVLPSQAAALGIPLVLVGVLLSANRFVRFVTNGWAGEVYARHGRNRPFFLAMVGATLTTFSYALPWGFWPFLAARLLWGTCFSFLRLGQTLAVLEHAGAAQRGQWLGRVQAVSRLGTVFALVAGGYLTDRMGYRFTILLFGALTAVGAVIAWQDRRHAASQPAAAGGPSAPSPAPGDQPPAAQSAAGALPSPPRPSAEAAPASSVPPAPDQDPMPRTRRPNLAACHCRRAAVLFAAGFAQGFAGFGLVMGTLSLLLLERFGQSVAILDTTVGVATLSGWLLGARWVLELVLAPQSGRLADRFGKRTTALAGAALQASALLLLARAAGAGATIASACVLFAGLVILAVSLETTAADLAAQGRPTVILSRYNTAQDLGAALGPSIGYTLGETLGLPAMYTGLAALLVVLAGLYAWAFRDAVPRARSVYP